MKAAISSRGKTIQLRYELPHRVHDAKIYPARAPNGSTIILYGHENGIGILWRGGRALKKAVPPPSKQPAKPPPKVNGTKSAIVIIDSDDDEPSSAAAPPPPPAEFEKEEEELDPDQPYSSIIQHVCLPLHTEVLHIAVPPLPHTVEQGARDSMPPIFNKKMVFAVACTDYGVRIITMPLGPPANAAKERPLDSKSPYGEEVFKVPTHVGHQAIPRGLSMTWTARGEHSHKHISDDEMEVDGEQGRAATPGRRSPRKKQSRSRSIPRGDGEGYDLLVASHSAELGGLVKFWRFGLADRSITPPSPMTVYETLTLRNPASKIAFNIAQYPKSRHSQLLITDHSGIARIYDIFAPRKGRIEPGAFVALFKTPFANIKINAFTPPVLATRKAIIDAAWVSDGHHVLALLADGEWGIWDVDRSGSSSAVDPSVFTVRGFVGTSDHERAASGTSSPKSRGNRSSLVPMTPNTRRRKEETLFYGSSSSSSAPTHGGVSVASLSATNGEPSEDSIIIWYGLEVHRIQGINRFRSRNASSGNGSAVSWTGHSQVHDIPLLGESISSVDQFDITDRETRMAVPRDVLIAAEHRLIITTSMKEPLRRDLNAAFESEPGVEEETRKTDRALLARGELDLGGMDRLLEDMEESGSGARSLVLGNPRKVLFASSTTG